MSRARARPLHHLLHPLLICVECLFAQATAAGVESIFDLMDMEDDERKALLNMSNKQLAEVNPSPYALISSPQPRP